MSTHVISGMSKATWERVKALPASNARMIWKSCEAYMAKHPTIPGAQFPYIGKGHTYNAGINKAKREKKNG